jgi:lysine 2,3-aminomutase
VALEREYPYYDPVHLLPEVGQAWWRAQAQQSAPLAAGYVVSDRSEKNSLSSA